MGEFEVPYCILYDLGYTYLGDKLDSIPNPFLKIETGSQKSHSNSEKSPMDNFFEVDVLGNPDAQ